MPSFLEKDGKRISVSTSEDLQAALAEGFTPIGGDEATFSDPASGRDISLPARAVDDGTAQLGLSRNASEFDDAVKREFDAKYGGTADSFSAFGQSALSIPTLGLSDFAFGEEGRKQREASPLASGLGTGAGIALTFGAGGGSAGARLLAKTPAGAVTRGATALGARGGTALKIGAATAEGAAFGLGEGVSQLALSSDPLTAEKVASTLSSNALLGAGLGAGAGVFAKALEKGVVKAKNISAARAERAAKVADGGVDDLVGLDTKELRAAATAEKTSIQTKHLDAVKTRKSDLADSIAAYQKESEAAAVYRALWEPGSKKAIAGYGKTSAIGVKGGRGLRNVVDDLEGLAARPYSARKSLAIEAKFLREVVEKADDIKASLTKKNALTPAREQFLAKADDLLKKNDELRAGIQGIDDIVKPVSSPRLEAIQELISNGGKKQGIAYDIGSALAYTAGSAVLPGGVLGGVALSKLAPLAGQKFAQLAELVTGRAGRAAGAQTERIANAVEAIATGVRRGQRAAPVAATEVLASAKYRPAGALANAEESEAPAPRKRDRLATLYERRAQELSELLEPGPTGELTMRLDKRKEVASRLDGVREDDPVLADRIETAVARRIEFLGSKLQKIPDYAAGGFGPTTHRISDHDAREFARAAWAVENPVGVLEKAASSTITPVEGEAVRAVAPEILDDFVQQLQQASDRSGKQLGYKQRLNLSILTDQPLDPALQPTVLRVLQSNFVNEEGSEGGTVAPKAQPQFGSVKKPEPTAAQSRAG